MSAKDPNENRPGYKETKVGWIPEEWVSSNVSEVSELVTDGEHQTPRRSEQGYYLLSARNVRDGFIDLSDVDYVDGEEFEKLSRRIRPRSGDVLVSCSGTIGRCAVVPEGLDFCMVRSVAIIRPDQDQIAPRYLCSTLSSAHVQWQMRSAVSQLAQGNLFQGAILALRLPVPSIAEQQSIAAILSTCDEAIEKTGDLIKAKQRQKKVLMQQLLTGKKRLPGFEGEWEFPKAEEVFERINQRGNGTEPVLSVTQDFGIVDRTEVGKRIDYDESNTHTYKTVEPNDFVISLRSFQGGLEISNLRGLVSPAYHVIRSCKPCCHQFYKYYFKSFEFIGRLDIAVIGIRDGKQVSYGDFSFLKIPYPPVEEQSAIADTLSAADSEIALLEARQSAFKQQKKALMQKLLTGQVRVKV